jgi:uncharacterized surface protein with fasciclin (FAS1) repeats
VRKVQGLAAVGAMAVLTIVIGACSTSPKLATGDQPDESVLLNIETVPSSAASAPTGNGVTKISDMFGPACGQIPKEGPGALQRMVNEPIATAISLNPLLTTLAKAITATQLGDTLDSAVELTVFAPDDSALKAWEAQHPGTLDQLTTTVAEGTSPNSNLVKVVTYHILGQRYDAAGLVQARTVDSLEGAQLRIGGTSTAPTINGVSVLCGNIPTKNATLFLIGQPLSLPDDSSG